MWTAVRFITEQETGGVLHPEEMRTKTREMVMEVLRTKHPDARPMSAASMDTYPDQPLELSPVDITKNMVTEVVGQIYGGEGPGGTKSVSLQHWLLSFGAASRSCG